MDRIVATRVGVSRETKASRWPCDRCGRDIQKGKNEGLHLCRSCRHDNVYIALVGGGAQ
jgi:hypothetical protein